MAWTTPITWATNQLVAASDMNAQIRDNANFVFNGMSLTKVLHVGAYATSSTSFADIDNTNLIITATITTGRARVFFSAPVFVGGTGGNNDYAALDIILDSTTRAGDATLRSSAGQWVASGYNVSCVAFETIFTGLSVGSHTFKPQWKVNVGTRAAYIYATGNAVQTAPVTFIVQEL